MITKIRNILRGIKQGFGTARMKQDLWDKEYAGGKWDLSKDTRGDPVYSYIRKYCNNGAVLELGCGSGNTGIEMEPDTYQHYTGVDISDVAIQAAMRRSENNGRERKNRYVQSDILTYLPDRKFNVVLFRDSIYYVSRGQLKSTLDRYAACLEEGGVFVVTVFSRQGYRKCIEWVENNCQVLEEYSASAAEPLIVVFRVNNRGTPRSAQNSGQRADP